MKKSLFFALILVSSLRCTSPDHPISYDAYSFSFPMRIVQAESLFHLNKRIAGNRIARFDSIGCKEIQITYVPGTLGSNIPIQVEGVSFYTRENVLSLKEKLEKSHENQFEPISSEDGSYVYYYKMELDESITLLLYTNVSNICAEQFSNKLEERPATIEEINRYGEVSVVAFTYNLNSKRYLDSYTTLDGYYDYWD